jgi:AraC family transcriptional regulator
MNDRAGPLPSANSPDTYGPVGPNSISYRVQRLISSRVASIPLVRGTARASVTDARSERLVITVQLEPALVQRRWVWDTLSDSDTHARGEVFESDKYRNLYCGRTGGYDSVEYHLPRTTLNNYTDTHRLQRVSIHLGDVSAECPVFVRLTHLVLLSLETPERFSPSFMDHFVMLFCAHVVQWLSVDAPKRTVHRGGLSAAQRRRAMEILSNGTRADVRLFDVAMHCGLSVSHFSRSFKLSFGQSMHRWVLAKRVERAKHLLLCSDESLTDIASQTGFCDQASFSRTFAKLAGSSPGRWRRDFKS